MKAWLRKVRSAMPLRDIWRSLAMKLRAHYQYYGISGNSRMIRNFGYVTIRAVYKWLHRRSQRRCFTWKRLNAYLARYSLPPARLVHHRYRPSPSPESD
jgi:hypothetical protein